MNEAFDISRRRLLLSLPALLMAPRPFVQAANRRYGREESIT